MLHALRAAKHLNRSKTILKPHLRTTTQVASLKPSIEERIVSDQHLFKIGENIHNFTVKDVRKIDEFNMSAVKLIHSKTKAEHLHLFRNDSNNVFLIQFRTTPRDSTGVPHILEHTVLCGSKKFPVRDPFFKMLNRSLATFMNAMTAPDYTMYPFSTQNFSDYQNLQQIYLDAVFRPNIRELDFLQEGWRLEHKDPKDPKTDIIIKGIVYNEMKGAFSENENILMQKVQNSILPDHTYGVISGGDPMVIPELTYEALKQFHATHYHPSNCRVYTYGNFPLKPTLAYLDEEYFSKYDYQDPSHTVVPKQKHWEDPKRDHITCRWDNLGGPIEKQHYMTITLLMNDITNVYETFLLQFLTELLIRGPNSPFYKSMIEPNFSGGYTATTGYDLQPRDSYFTIGLQKLDKKDFGKVLEIFDKTITDVIKTGFDSKHVESVLHTYELGIKHETSNFGLNLLYGITALWNHNGDVIEALQVNNFLQKLRNNMKKEPTYLQSVVEKYFLNNKHRLILSMSPDPEYEVKHQQREKEIINSKVTNLTEEQKKDIYAKGLELLKEQNSVQDANILPTLTIEDINNEVEKVPKEIVLVKPVHTQINKVNTNGIVYFRGIINGSHLSPEQHMMLPLFCDIITKLGTNTMNYREFENEMHLKTSGMNFSVHIADSLYQLHSFEQGISISSYCLEKNTQSMFDLWRQIFEITKLQDIERFKTLVQLYVANLTNGVANAGHQYAILAATGLVSGATYQRDLLMGLQHIAYMKRLVKTQSYEAMLLELSNIANALFDKTKLRCCFNVLESKKNEVQKIYENFIGNLPGNQLGTPNETSFTTAKIWAPSDSAHCQHHVFNVPIYFCSKGILTVPFTDPDYSKLKVLSKLLTSKYLHPELREKRGAYGAGAKLNTDGVFSFFSYRDPKHLETLDVFDESAIWIDRDLKLVSDQEILEAKLSLFQAIDAPTPPGTKGVEQFSKGITRDILMRHRAEIMAVNIKDLMDIGEKYFGNKSNCISSKVILGPKADELVTKSRRNELWTIVDKDM